MGPTCPGHAKGGTGFHLAQTDESLAALVARNHAFNRGQETVAARARQQQRGAGRAGKVMQHLGARLQLDQRGDRLAVAARTGQHRHRNGIQATVAAKHQQGIDGATFKRAVQRIAGLEGKAGWCMTAATARAAPSPCC